MYPMFVPNSNAEDLQNYSVSNSNPYHRWDYSVVGMYIWMFVLGQMCISAGLGL
jgi:hypothetical protein